MSSLGLANPQWTPLVEAAPAWMKLGFELFQVLETLGRVHEVFPTATYSQLLNATDLFVQIPLTHFAFGPKDMLDAYAAAATVMEFECGRGAQVGGGDGYGGIVLPRPVDFKPARLFAWPS